MGRYNVKGCCVMFGNVKDNLFVFTAATVLMLYSNIALSDNFIECYACTVNDMHNKANTWAINNITPTEAQQKQVKDVHIINILDNEIKSFRVSLRLTALPPPFPPEYLPSSSLIDTPQRFKQSMIQLKNTRDDLKVASRVLTIPTSEIADAWQFVHCAFCENNVSRYINNSLNGEILAAQMTIATIAQTFGLINTGIPDTYQINLDSGGFLELVMTLNNEPVSLKIIVTKVVDPDGNTVPFSAEKLNNLLLQISSLSRALSVNYYIQRFNFVLPVRMGFVEITCPKVTKEDPIPKPCG